MKFKEGALVLVKLSDSLKNDDIYTFNGRLGIICDVGLSMYRVRLLAFSKEGKVRFYPNELVPVSSTSFQWEI